MKILITLSVIACLAIASIQSHTLQQAEITTWEEFKITFGRKFATPEEEALRKENFLKSLAFVTENNGKDGVTLGINEFSDLSESELPTMDWTHLSKHLNASKLVTPIGNSMDEYAGLPDHFDWREHVQINPIENQGSCGSCYAFAAVATVEILLAARHNRQHVHLSKQELVDCTASDFDHAYRNTRCGGGYPDDTYEYIRKQGLHEETAYRYSGQAHGRCNRDHAGNTKFHINEHYRLNKPAPDAAIMNVVHTSGPGVVVIHGTSAVFQHYRGGVMRNLLPNSPTVNHVVAVMGWGVDNGVPYWTIRNSWGAGWGEQGYARIERNHNNVAFNDWFSYPILH